MTIFISGLIPGFWQIEIFCLARVVLGRFGVVFSSFFWGLSRPYLLGVDRIGYLSIVAGDYGLKKWVRIFEETLDWCLGLSLGNSGYFCGAFRSGKKG